MCEHNWKTCIKTDCEICDRLADDDSDGWTSECPTTAGEWEFRCEAMSGILRGEFNMAMVKRWHTTSTNPQWRPLKGVEDDQQLRGEYAVVNSHGNAPDIEPPMTDKEWDDFVQVMLEPESDETESAFLEMKARADSLETRLAAAERERDEARDQLYRIANEGYGMQDTIGGEACVDYVLRQLEGLKNKS